MDLQKVKLLGEEKLETWITRVDLFKDFFDGEYNVDRAMEDYNNGLFKSDFGGRQPKDNLIGPTNSEAKAGRTYYIGDRKNGKVIRIYEKGKKEGIFEGTRSKWVRTELELHGSNPDSKSGKLIPWDVLDRPGSYLAGSCKALEFTSNTHDRIKTISVKMVSSLEQSVKYAKHMFGRVVNVLHDMGYSPLQIQNLLIRDDFPDWHEKKAIARSGEEEEILNMCRDVFGEDADWGGVPDLGSINRVGS